MLTREEYEEKRQARYDRLLAAASKAQKESNAAREESDRTSSFIPLGQPILVGHYSEGRDRRYRERIRNKMRKGYELAQKAEYYRQRATATQDNDAIFSDDPDATEKIQDKITRLEKRQELMKQANKLIRKNDRAGLQALGFSDTTIAKLFVPDYLGRVGFPNYEITNNGANIRRLKERLTQVSARQAAPDREYKLGNITIEESPSENRIRIYYPGKPDEATRTNLKRNGFRWAPSMGAWQAYYNNSSRWFIQGLIKDAQTQNAPTEAQDETTEPAPTQPTETQPANVQDDYTTSQTPTDDPQPWRNSKHDR